jgi:hypothetical protein
MWPKLGSAAGNDAGWRGVGAEPFPKHPASTTAMNVTTPTDFGIAPASEGQGGEDY